MKYAFTNFISEDSVMVLHGKTKLEIMDELMETLSIIQPRLYDAVMDRLA